MNIIIPYNQFEEWYPLDEQVGKGTYGVVYKVKEQSIVVKISTYEKMIQDMNILCQFNHPNIIPPLNISFKDDKGYIAFPLGKKLLDNLPRDKKVFMFQLSCGLNALHKARIIHGDIKPENIVIIDDVVKMIDFGLSYVADNHNYGSLIYYNCGTEGFKAPESIDNIMAPNDDIYSLGKTFECIYYKKYEITFNVPVEGGNDLFNDLIQKMMSPRSQRLTIDEVQLHPYFDDVRNIDCMNSNSRLTTPIYTKTSLIFNNIDKSIYYKLIDLLIDIADTYNLEIKTLFLCIHNIHRSVPMLQNISVVDFDLFGMVHLFLASVVIGSVNLSPSLCLRSLESNYTDTQFNNMVYEVCTELNGIINTNTFWNECVSSNNLINFFEETINWDYTYNYHFEQTDNLSSNNVDTRHFLDEWYKERNITATNKLQFLETIIDSRKMDILKVDTSIKSIPNIILPDIELVYQRLKHTNRFTFEEVYYIRQKLVDDLILANRILSNIFDMAEYKQNQYDIIYGEDKITGLQEIDVENLPYNTYVLTLEEIFEKIGYHNNDNNE
jgi:serine/threonine protein kinase